jgi:site-specific DNA recombinase
MTHRAALYLRVSTARQADKDLSIPDQRKQVIAYCKGKGWEVTTEYVEPGASATDDKRPAFQRMIDEACSTPHPFDVIVVHSFSRFFRDMVFFGVYARRLEKHGIRVISITQETGDDAQGEMMRAMISTFDWYSSRENAKHVLRAMKENARQGFWNGSQPPYGYRTYVAEMRAGTAKKRLEIEPSESEIVRRIFALYLQGAGRESMGLRAIAAHLNEKGLRYRKGRAFTSGLVQQILRRTAYVGRHFFNRKELKTKKRKDPSEWVEMATPVVIDSEIFETVQRVLKSRRPTNTPPRIVNGPTLLTGLAKCATCGGGMTLRTGKNSRYRYYTCNKAATEGKCSCKGRNIPMQALDDLVIGELETKLFQRDRFGPLMEELIRRNADRTRTTKEEAKQLQKELRTAEEKLQRLYNAIADGTLARTDSLKITASRLEQRRDELLRLISSTERKRQLPAQLLTPKNLDRFTAAMRQAIRSPENGFRKAYVRKFVERIEVDDEEVRIYGSHEALARTLAERPTGGGAAVHGFVPEWWARQDSNLRQHRYERRVLTS